MAGTGVSRYPAWILWKLVHGKNLKQRLKSTFVCPGAVSVLGPRCQSVELVYGEVGKPPKSDCTFVYPGFAFPLAPGTV